MKHGKLSIVILCYNAPVYVRKLLKSLEGQEGADYEIIIVDNNSRWLNSFYFFFSSMRLRRLRSYVRASTNLFFAGGMNLGVRQCSSEATHVLLLNSDTEFRDPLALKKVMDVHERGVTGFGEIGPPLPRCDGFFFLVDRDLYEEIGGLDEKFKWWWSITKFQGLVLSRGLTVKAISNHDDLLVHFGGKSGDAWKAVNSPDIPDEASSWFPEDRTGYKVISRI